MRTRQNLIRECVKCGRVYGEKEPYEDRSITSGYCPRCFKEEMEELEKRIEAKERRNPMTPSELKYEVERAGHSPYFFTSKTMKFFGDKMSNYGVRSARAITYSGEEFEVWELYRRRPVKHGLQASAFFRKDTFERVHPKLESENPRRRMSKADVEDYINEIGIPDHDHPGFGGRVSWAWIRSHGEYSYGTWLRKHDPIAFEIAYNEQNY